MITPEVAQFHGLTPRRKYWWNGVPYLAWESDAQPTRAETRANKNQAENFQKWARELAADEKRRAKTPPLKKSGREQGGGN